MASAHAPSTREYRPRTFCKSNKFRRARPGRNASGSPGEQRRQAFLKTAARYNSPVSYYTFRAVLRGEIYRSSFHGKLSRYLAERRNKEWLSEVARTASTITLRGPSPAASSFPPPFAPRLRPLLAASFPLVFIFPPAFAVRVFSAAFLRRSISRTTAWEKAESCSPDDGRPLQGERRGGGGRSGCAGGRRERVREGGS